MSNLQMYCLTLNSDHLTLIKSLNFIPVGLGNGNFNQNWETDKNTKSKLISNKNQYYGEYTFHYKLWKNDILPENKWLPNAENTNAAGGTNPKINSTQTSFIEPARNFIGKTGPNFGSIQHRNVT